MRKDPPCSPSPRPPPPWLPELGQEAEQQTSRASTVAVGCARPGAWTGPGAGTSLGAGRFGQQERHCSLEPRSCPPARPPPCQDRGGLSSDLRSHPPGLSPGSSPHHQLRGGHRFTTWSAPEAASPSQIRVPPPSLWDHRLVTAALAPSSSVPVPSLCDPEAGGRPMPVWPSWG